MKEDTGPRGIHGDAQESLTLHSGNGDVTPSDQGSPVPLAKRPPEVRLSVQHSDMSSFAVRVLGLHPKLWHPVSSAQLAHSWATAPAKARKLYLGKPTPCLLESVCVLGMTWLHQLRWMILT